MKQFITYILFVSAFCLNGNAQLYKPINYKIEDGLPSTELHDIYEDANGYLWLTTDRGIVRFDGQNFEVWDSERGLPNIVNFNFFEVNENKVWLTNVLNEMYWFDPLSFPLKFTPYEHNDSLVAAFGKFKWNEHIRKMWVDENGDYNFTFLVSPGRIKIQQDGNFEILNWKFYELNEGYKESHYNQDILVYFSNDPKNPHMVSEYVAEGSGEIPYELFLRDLKSDSLIKDRNLISYKYRPFYGIVDHLITDSCSFFLLGDHIYKYQNGHLRSAETSFNGLRIGLKDNLIYVGTNGGIDVYDIDLNHQYKFLSGVHVTDLHWDRNGGLWVTSGNVGLNHIIDERIKTVPFENGDDKIFVNVEVNEEYIYGITWDNKLHILDKSLNQVFFQKEVGFSSGMYLFVNKNPEVSKYFGSPMAPYFNDWKTKSSIYQSVHWEEYDSLRCARKIVESYRVNEKSYDNLAIPEIFNGIRVNDTIYMATQEGLYVFGFNGEPKPYSDHPVLQDKFIDIKHFRGGILLPSYNNGLVYLKNDEVYTIDKSVGLSSSSISCIEIQDDETIWVGSYYGLDKLEIGENFRDIKISNLNSSKGLVSNEVRSLEVFNDTVWVATKKGLNFFPADLRINNQVLRNDLFVTDSIKINDQLISTDLKSFELSEQDVLELFFTQIAYSPSSNVTYEYRLDPIDSKWISASSGYLRFSNLSAEEYTLSIRAVSESNVSAPVQFHLKVSLPWWKSWWAILIYVLLSLGLIALVFKFLLKRLDKRRRGELEKAQLELKALISQMNPHFTFNTINSIQHYIIENDSKKALDYLAEFAYLMRQSLDFSRREHITLKEEIDFLRLYVDLEASRFGKPIEFIVDIETRHTPDIIAFPALLLQPIIENAVVHGLQNVDYDGKIWLSIIEREDYFDIEISDNGVGLEAGKERKDKNHRSHGLDILKERISLYNAVNRKESDLQIVSGEDHPEKNTIVKIRLYKVNTINN